MSADLVRSYLASNPKAPTRTIARMLREDHPEEFASIEQARSRVRYHRGNLGNHNRNKAQRAGNTEHDAAHIK